MKNKKLAEMVRNEYAQQRALREGGLEQRDSAIRDRFDRYYDLYHKTRGVLIDAGLDLHDEGRLQELGQHKAMEQGAIPVEYEEIQGFSFEFWVTESGAFSSTAIRIAEVSTYLLIEVSLDGWRDADQVVYFRVSGRLDEESEPIAAGETASLSLLVPLIASIVGNCLAEVWAKRQEAAKYGHRE
jgi:hypothetical protein